ncbi:CBF-domain-containing protein [Meira miltonrushii]|uniref:CBF-domain-containing protein n=1 Tax=Meira miltonrushii TaxID=1280837 RepID=A0A316VEF6_9BASI|nr:CBF-domain-containing protein [Meira miltonrushii]PWN36037.1 CBF-domain-containing protein [Meira miltonrushii]
MARDFRPKAARQAAAATAKKGGAKQIEGKATAPAQAREKEDVQEGSSSEEEEGEDENDEEEDKETLLREIRALGGDEKDLELINSVKGKGRETDEDGEMDPALQKELLSFMQALDYKGAGVVAPSFDSVKSNGKKESTKDEAADDRKQKEENKRKEREEKRKQKERKAEEKKRQENNPKQNTKAAVDQPIKPSVAEVESNEVKSQKQKAGFVMIPTPQWSEVEMPELPASSSSTSRPLSQDSIHRLQGIAEELLHNERNTYVQLTNSGKTGSGGPGLLSTSDARFINELLAPGARGGTLSDRIAALTLLLQTSPLHNVDAMETLLAMAGKKGREESGKATRALSDWLASGVGLPERKLRYFRDQPQLALMADLQNDSSLRGKAKHPLDMHLVFAAYEDKLKRFNFEFLKLLETQSHDTLPFVRKQAVTHIYVLLKEKPEQEQNLLRLLVNKLGDADRSVASKASSHLLNLLSSHPAMKSVVTNEVSNLVMHAPSGSRMQKGKSAGPNAHAQYFGVLTLNQTMLSAEDEKVANRLVQLYFELFEGLLQGMAHKAGGKEEPDSTEPKEKRDKGRWRDGKKGGNKGGMQKSQKKQREEEEEAIQDADAKIIAAILAGVRRALPFAKIDGGIVDKHMDMLFRITHCSTFNISIQALQLIQQVCLTGHGKASMDSLASTKLQDRFYRALYASLLDPRLAKTSKQAMYLNLVFKAVKFDLDDARTKAFVKRLTQLLNSSEPPFICGSLYLLGQLFIAKPGLRTMLKDAEEDGEEHFVDVEDEADNQEDDPDKSKMSTSSKSQARVDSSYDGLKRDPKYARANASCLWELVPLLSHFHPSVSLCAAQLLTSQRIHTTADLTLHTLAHFLDRFVYRNPKKNVAISKGASLMQPALHANGIDAGVMRLRGQGIQKDEFVNDEAFWRKQAKDVPADQLFFHKYFNLRRGPTKDEEAKKDISDAEDMESEDDIEGDEDVSNLSDEEDSEMEKEIWKEMRRTIPREGGDDMLDESDVDEDDDDADLEAALRDAQSSDDEELQGLDDDEDEDLEDSDEEDLEGDFDEDEDDLLPFQFGSDDEESDVDASAPSTKDRKRKADDAEEEETDKPKSKSQLQRAERKKRKAMPTFATADDYAHLLGGSDDE